MSNLTNKDQLTLQKEGADPKTQLITAIRGWVHFDNLAENLNRQTLNARELRSKHESNAIRVIQQLGMTTSVIQIADAQLQMATRREPASLTWSYLEEQLPQWATHSGITPIQVQSLMKWLQEHRETKEKNYLKKIRPAASREGQ
jgi:hypothetical protein